MEQYYQSLSLISLSELIGLYKEETIISLLSTFQCNINCDLEIFLHHRDKALSFEKRNITRTYLYVSETKELVAYFTLSLNVLSTSNLSKSIIKKLDGIDKNRSEIACYLIAQLGKSDRCPHQIGAHILSDAIDTVKDTSMLVGGRFIVLDAVNHDKVIRFYESNNFIVLPTTSTSQQSIKMYYPLVM